MILWMAATKHPFLTQVTACSVSNVSIWKHQYVEGEASLSHSTYSPHSIIGINEQNAPPRSRGSVIYEGAVVSHGESQQVREFLVKGMLVLTSSPSAIPCPCRTEGREEKKNSTRGWLGCSSELCHKSDWTFLNICCGWLAPWPAEFDRRERESLVRQFVCVVVPLLSEEGGFCFVVVCFLRRTNYFCRICIILGTFYWLFVRFDIVLCECVYVSESLQFNLFSACGNNNNKDICKSSI